MSRHLLVRGEETLNEEISNSKSDDLGSRGREIAHELSFPAETGLLFREETYQLARLAMNFLCLDDIQIEDRNYVNSEEHAVCASLQLLETCDAMLRNEIEKRTKQRAQTQKINLVKLIE